MIPTMQRALPKLLLVLLTCSLTGCTVETSTGGPGKGSQAPSGDRNERPTFANENLNAALWVQSSPEYRAAAIQAFVLARARLVAALGDPAWTASLEQQQVGGYDSLPPAVIADVDETLLDNSGYQARLLLHDEEFATVSWQRWVREERARPIPGAVEFARYAADHGVTLVYITNRRADVEEPTRRNLERVGFPVAAGEDVLLTRGERPDWGSDKSGRRLAVARRFRILLLIGDNLGDFLAHVNVARAERDELSARYRQYWGVRWILLPNPQYGSWDGTLINFDYGMDRAEKLQLKVQALDPMEGEREGDGDDADAR